MTERAIKTPARKKALLLNLAFIGACAAIVFFLFQAPEESTKRLPLDADHAEFHQMDKKQAEKLCDECHNPDGVALPDDHPPKYRCLFCHKR